MRSAEATMGSRILKTSEEKQPEGVSKPEERDVEQVSEPEEEPVGQVSKPEEKVVDQVSQPEDKQVDQVSKPEDELVDEALSEVQKPQVEVSASDETKENDISIGKLQFIMSVSLRDCNSCVVCIIDTSFWFS